MIGRLPQKVLREYRRIADIVIDRIRFRVAGEDADKFSFTKSGRTVTLTANLGELSGGEPVELGTSATHVQWRAVGDEEWTDLIALSEISGEDGSDGTNGTDGEDGQEVSLQKTATHVQWRLGSGSWTDLIALSEISGEDGTDGTDGVDGADGQGFTVRGDWSDAGVAYLTYDITHRDGSSWLCVVSHTSSGAHTPGSSINWVEFAAGGEDGTDGTNGTDGEDGQEVSLQKTATHIQWRLGSGSWTDLVALSEISGEDGTNGTNGTDGEEVSLQKTATHIQWRLGSGSWTDLVALSEISGEDGTDGDDGADGAGVKVGDITETARFELDDGELWCDGSAYAVGSGSDYQELALAIGATSGYSDSVSVSFTVTSGSAAITTTAPHGLAVGDLVAGYFLTYFGKADAGGCPAEYQFVYVKTVTDSTTFEISETDGGAALLSDTSATTIALDLIRDFRVPDRRDRIAIGRGNMGGTDVEVIDQDSTDELGATFGRETHKELIDHDHAYLDRYDTGNAGQASGSGGRDNNIENLDRTTGGPENLPSGHSVSTDTAGVNHMPPVVVCNYVIRYQ